MNAELLSHLEASTPRLDIGALQSWPIFAAALAVTLILVLPGLFLWWPLRREAQRRVDLAQSLLGGAIVAFAVLSVQFYIDARLRDIERQRGIESRRLEDRREAAAARQQLQLALIFQRDISRLPLEGRDLRGIYLVDKNLSEGKFNRADLTSASLDGSTLNDAQLEEARLVRASLVGASMNRAALFGADLTGAVCASAKLREASILDADLAGADLSDADLTDADLEGANLSGTDLRGTDGSLPTARLKDAKFDARTRWPKGFSPEAAGALRRKGVGGIR